MPNMAIVSTHNKQLFLYSWTTGVVKAKIPNRIKTEDDALAYALYLSRRGMQEEAEHFLDHYCS